ncbi:acetyl-CoA C-acetyltransferase [Viridibacillus sp. FSL R5-0477]|nr:MULTISPECIES: acetyl-CoA C-acetyltransferase [Viridibacillus]OMC85310.1 beta-ketoadipyl CoA thiolase [Viridibacillus sp. FSL H8-0123]OMC87493.1 beta-ketoadipyl CoA thiolase [Viridibacillus sp. FSL H7-0596]OMC92728.1 beta-ketoadipyl CoA thiolase [Viridibacillus arenosi]
MKMEAYILNGSRTAFGTFGGSFKNTSDIDLAVATVKETIKRSGVEVESIDEIIFGNIIHTTSNSAYLARHIGLKSGMTEYSTALTVNRLCGSGLQAIVSAAKNIILGETDAAIAGGTENMSLAPHVLRGTRFGSPNKAPEIDDMLWETLYDQYAGCGMGMTAENLADKYGITREEQDAFSMNSHKKASIARESGRFAEEIVPVVLKGKKGKEIIINQDEHIRTDISAERLGKLNPAFKETGTVTAGNASGINDGAASVLVVSSDYLEKNKLQPLAKIVSWGIAGVDPKYMGIGPVPAIRKALQKAKLEINQIDLFELNEAFAAQSLAVVKELEIDEEKVNVNGGAVALGHPVGASGARISYSLAVEMNKRNVRYGVASLCIGGGQGIAIILENPNY